VLARVLERAPAAIEVAADLGAEQPHRAPGVAYRMKGELGKAQQAFESALGRNPTTAEGQRLLADLCVLSVALHNSGFLKC